MVESTAHPLLVLHFSHNVMFGKVSVANRNLQGEDYSRIFRITSIWEKEAPADFRGVVSTDFWREHGHPCSDNGSSPDGGIPVGNKRRRPSPADAQRDYGGGRKKPKLRGYKYEGHKPEAPGTSDGKHLAHSRTYNLMSTDSGSHQLSAQNLRLLQLQMDHRKPSEPRRRRSQPPPLISDHSSLASVQRRRRRRKSVSLPLSPSHNDLPKLVFRWLQNLESGEPILDDFDMTLNHCDRAEAVRPVDDAILYSREPPRVLATGGGYVLDPAYITSTQWAWKKYKVRL